MMIIATTSRLLCTFVVVALVASLTLPARGAEPPSGSAADTTKDSAPDQTASVDDAAKEAIRQQLAAYVEAFNRHDAAAIAEYWTTDGVSVNQNTGEKVEGRGPLEKEFARYFKEYPDVFLVGTVDDIRFLRPDVAMVDGKTSLTGGAEGPIDASFSVVLVNDEKWLIKSSSERETPAPTSSHEALGELAWMIGTWKDQSDAARVTTTIRWSSKQAFLIRSFHARFREGDTVEGTQVIGWDPLSKEIKTWTFNSDGSFGNGTITKSDGEWLVKLAQVGSDGSVSTAIQTIKPIDDNMMTVQTVARTVNGVPAPSGEPITVVREEDPSAPANAAEGEASGETGVSPAQPAADRDVAAPSEGAKSE